MPSYYDHYLIDNAHGIILGVEATPARFRQEMLAARRMLEQVRDGGESVRRVGCRQGL